MLSHYRYSVIIFYIFFVTVIPPYINAQDVNLKFDRLTINNGLPQNTVYSIVKDKYGFMWFGTWGGACRYDGYSLKIFRANEDDHTALPDNRINTIVCDKFQNIWIQTGNLAYLCRYNFEYENFTRYLFDRVPDYVKKLFKSPKNRSRIETGNNQYTWISDHKKLLQINRLTRKSLSYTSDLSNPFSVSDNQINIMYLDDCENLWIGTQNGGVNHASLNIKQFLYYNVDRNGKRLAENVVRTICTDKTGKVWVGSENKGITIIDRVNNKYEYLGEKELENPQIRSVCCDKYGIIWIGTKRGLFSYDPYSKKLKNCSVGICDPNVFALLEDHNGDFWVGTFHGLAWYDRTNNHFLCFPLSLTGGKYIHDVIEDHCNNLWVATEDEGVTELQRTTSSDLKYKFRPIRYVHKEGVENSLILNRTYSLTEDKYGMIWIATNAGLSRLNPKNKTFRNFTVKNGLPDDICMGVLFDGKESVWISHKKGLTRINTRTFEFQNFNMYDGLQGNEFSQNACYRDHTTGEMFFGGINGLNSFFPDRIKVNRIKPQVVFTQLSVMNQVMHPGSKINNRIILPKSLLCTDQITLSWWDNTFSLEFAALHFANPLGNKYKYKLKGYDRQWIYTDASMRTASYSHLPSGTYKFEVYASNSDGVWCDHPASLIIKVLPPWWLTWWAIAFYIFIGLIIIYFIYKYILERIEFNKNEEIHQAKLRFFTEVSHEFRTPLTLIIDPLERIINEHLPEETIRQYCSLMHRNAKQLLSLINQVLDFRKLEAGRLTLNLQNLDIVSFIRSTASLFETQARKRNITFSVCSSLDQLMVHFDASKLNMVINNLLSNAFKFTPDQGKIEISLDLSTTVGNEVVIKVRDNGIGIPDEEQKKVFDIFYQSKQTLSKQEGSGIGLALAKELIQLHGGRIILESETGKGSCFSIFLPATEKDGMNIPGIPQEADHIEEISPKRNASLNGSSIELPLMLVVDDNADIRNYIKLNFERDYHVELASNGSEGFERAVETIPDIVISDIMMPGMDGLELCRSLKSDERTSHIPVILLTARQSDEAKTEGYETGADAYVIKPFSTNVLRSQLQNLLAQRQRLRELFSKGSDIELKKIAINITDEAFLKKVTLLVEENLEKENFDMDSLAEILNMSRSQFYRKIKALTNKSLHDFVTTLRMNKAITYLVSGEYNISETAFKVGYSQPNNFTRTFIKYSGTSPSKYIENLKR